MAGKFLSLEEAARLLGKSTDEVNRLVDLKKLFPMRDGGAVKFKTDDVERVLRELGEEGSSASDGLELELDIDTPRLDLDVGDDQDQLVLDDAVDSIFTTPAVKGPSGSDTGVGQGSGVAKSNSGLELAGSGALGGGDLVLSDEVLGDEVESEDLSIESITGASSPALGSGVDLAAGSGPLAVGLSGIGGGSGVGPKSGSGIGGLSGPGLGGLSGGLGSGVSLGDSSLADSGVDLGSAASAAKAGASSDDFELGGESGEEESASVVIASDSEAGDSSFFGKTIDGQSSTFGDDSSLGSTGSSEGLVFPTRELEEMSFSVWQIVGLVCCSLLLLFGGFIAYDLVRTIGSPENTSLSNPLLNSLAQVFGWR